MKRKTLVLGASTNPERYSNIAIKRLSHAGHEVVAIGNKAGAVAGVDILTDLSPINDIDTVTLYLNPKRQEAYYDYILELQPKRIIFNPGTENPTLMKLATENGIEPEIACTLVLLATDSY